MYSNYSSNKASFDKKVIKLIREYQELTNIQQSQFQRALLNGDEFSVEGEVVKTPVTWQDAANVIGPIQWDWKGWLAKVCGGPIKLDPYLAFLRGRAGPSEFERAARRARTLTG